MGIKAGSHDGLRGRACRTACLVSFRCFCRSRCLPFLPRAS
ncbi:hypothetical protein BSU04_27755 [Caballeronia sordidicola]|uniref:Uncharacterized protein n=1 Tax=Caballeronia sordidicola TaxID=196367 RepID=A0A226WVP1_CABSO|nr:hypothetical protein BSU04_27755 [Caballeronia sordidicola]